ncbi:hypothetical protein PQX77_021727 [Marasmius sp. AFHP31]|nr:hypothetical protein PQX77_021727 [Marasmius sp. AFHP31]
MTFFILLEQLEASGANPYWSATSPRDLEQMETMLQNSNEKYKNFFRYVRRIVITSPAVKSSTTGLVSYALDREAITEIFSRWRERNDHRWSVFVTLLSRIPLSFESIIDCGSGAIPLTLLQALHIHHPSCHLHLRNWAPSASYTGSRDPFIEALAKSPCLHSVLSSDAPGYDSNLAYQDLTFERVISLAPSLEWIALL